MKIQSPRGTKDWFDQDIEIRRYIESIERELCRFFNIKEIDTPMFESTELFERGVGDTTDIVQKEMYTFNDKKNRSITLKPEGTASTVRLFMQNNLYANVQPTKLFYIMPMFRYEKPQSGRLRQHHQFGVEYFGVTEPTADIEVINLLIMLFNRLNMKDIKLHINSIGCGHCREEYNKELIEYLQKHKTNLCITCNDRLEKNPMRTIDCKEKACKVIVKDAPRIIDYLDDDCNVHFNELKTILESLNIQYIIDKDIVRGQDYYTKTVFEFIDSTGSTICGGGRYDSLVEKIGGKEIPAVGFGIGIERLLLSIKEQNIEPNIDNTPDLFIGYIGDEAKRYTHKLANNLRQKNIMVEVEHLNRSLKAQMKFANKIGAKNVAIIGDEEIKSQKCMLKNMNSREEKEVEFEKIEISMLI